MLSKVKNNIHMKQINEQLRAIAKDYQLLELYDLTGFHISQLSKWMNGDDFMTLDTLNRLASGLGYSVEGIDEDSMLDLIKYETQDYSIDELQRMTKVNAVTFWNIRQGKKPNLSTMLKILDKFGFKMDFTLVKNMASI